MLFLLLVVQEHSIHVSQANRSTAVATCHSADLQLTNGLDSIVEIHVKTFRTSYLDIVNTYVDWLTNQVCKALQYLKRKPRLVLSKACFSHFAQTPIKIQWVCFRFLHVLFYVHTKWQLFAIHFALVRLRFYFRHLSIWNLLRCHRHKYQCKHAFRWWYILIRSCNGSGYVMYWINIRTSRFSSLWSDVWQASPFPLISQESSTPLVNKCDLQHDF